MLLIWLSVALCIGCALSHRDFMQKERVRHPRGWYRGARAPAAHTLHLKIGLPQPSFHVLERHLYEVSDPDHVRYGQYLAREDIESFIAPHDSSIEAVDAWLHSYGIDKAAVDRSPARDWFTIRVPVAVAENMLDTEFFEWTHEESREIMVRTLSYSLPAEVHDHIDLIQPTTMFSQMKKHRTSFRWSAHQDLNAPVNATPIELENGVTVEASCNQTVTVSCLKQLYNAVGVNGTLGNGNGIGITGYLQQHANVNDLQLFYADQVPSAQGSSFNFISIHNGTNPQDTSNAGVEADLDSQFAFGVTYPMNHTFYSIGGSPPYKSDTSTPTNTNEPYLNWLEYVLQQESLPLTISTSYGDDEQTVPPSYAQRVCQGFAQLGARGVTLTFSSGDGGVGDGDADPSTHQCQTNDGRNRTQFLPGFPATCPYITAVGGTVHIPETAVSFSGGGFSNLFERPSYQNEAVARYLDSLPPGLYEGLYNSSGRAYPDVSALADNFKIYWQAKAGLIGGTSASSPTFAAFITLLNDARIANGQPPLGFINPLLYKLNSEGLVGLNDITTGNNPGCGTQGFNATVGWDPVTGLGTPDFGKLKDLVLSGELSDEYKNTTDTEVTVNDSEGAQSGSNLVSSTPPGSDSGASSQSGLTSSSGTSPTEGIESASATASEVTSMSSKPSSEPQIYVGGPGNGQPDSSSTDKQPLSTNESELETFSSVGIEMGTSTPYSNSPGSSNSQDGQQSVSSTSTSSSGSERQTLGSMDSTLTSSPSTFSTAALENTSSLNHPSSSNLQPSQSLPFVNSASISEPPTIAISTSSSSNPNASPASGQVSSSTSSSSSPPERSVGYNIVYADTGINSSWCRSKNGVLRRRRTEL